MRSELLELTRQLRLRVLQSKPSAWTFSSTTSSQRQVMFIGEPCDGEAGRLFDKILEAIGLSRQTVYIADLSESLDRQIARIGPRVLVTLGEAGARLLGDETPLAQARGQWRSYTPQGGTAVRVLPTLHPAALLGDPGLKRDAWTDMKNLKKELES